MILRGSNEGPTNLMPKDTKWPKVRNTWLQTMFSLSTSRSLAAKTRRVESWHALHQKLFSSETSDEHSQHTKHFLRWIQKMKFQWKWLKSFRVLHNLNVSLHMILKNRCKPKFYYFPNRHKLKTKITPTSSSAIRVALDFCESSRAKRSSVKTSSITRKLTFQRVIDNHRRVSAITTTDRAAA